MHCEEQLNLTSNRHAELMKLLRTRCKQHGIECDVEKVFQCLRELPERYEQMRLY